MIGFKPNSLSACIINGWWLELAQTHDYTRRAASHESRHVHEWRMDRCGLSFHFEFSLRCNLGVASAPLLPCGKIPYRHGVDRTLNLSARWVLGKLGCELHIALNHASIHCKVQLTYTRNAGGVEHRGFEIIAVSTSVVVFDAMSVILRAFLRSLTI